MEITVNLQSVTVNGEISIQRLMDDMYAQKQKGVAVAIGERIITRSLWHETQIKERDVLTIITATQGG